jgi:mono/diheme cytochrome c family protein
MRWTRIAGITGVAATLAVALGAASCTTTATNTSEPAAMTAGQQVARGRYLATTMGCVDCHTPGTLFGAPDTTRTLAGSEMGWTGPWGTTYARNLTPDIETGIGSWTEAQIETALRTGVRPDGSPILPPMPWPNLTQMDEADMDALIAYLKSIPAVKHANPPVLPPGQTGTLPALVFPAPPAWDAMNLPPPTAPAAGGAGH